jgi:hypothetical protein
VGRRLIVADSHKSNFYFGERESPANVPGERKYTLGKESGILRQCFMVVHSGQLPSGLLAEFSPTPVCKINRRSTYSLAVLVGDEEYKQASAAVQRWASSFRTVAAELPTLSTIFCNSAWDTPSSLIQYFTSQRSCMLILLRSGVSLLVRLSISTPSNIFVDWQTRAAWRPVSRVLENLATPRSQFRFRSERDAKITRFQLGDRQRTLQSHRRA